MSIHALDSRQITHGNITAENDAIADETTTESVEGGYVGNEKAQENLEQAKSKLDILISQGKTTDDRELQDVMYEVEYWQNMIQEAAVHGEKNLMKDPCKTRMLSDKARKCARDAICTIDNVKKYVEDTGRKTAKGMLGFFKKVAKFAERFVPFGKMIRNKLEKKRAKLQNKVNNGKASQAEKEELKNTMGSLAVINQFIKDGGKATLTDAQYDAIFDKAKNQSFYAEDGIMNESYDALEGVGHDGGYVGDEKVAAGLKNAKMRLEAFKDKGEDDPDYKKALFDVRYFESIQDQVKEFGGEKAVKNNPKLAKAIHERAEGWANYSVNGGTSSGQTIPEDADILKGRGLDGGYTGDANVRQGISDCEADIKRLEAEGKGDDDPEMKQAKFNLKYYEKALALVGLHGGEKAVRINPKLAKAIHLQAMEFAKAMPAAPNTNTPPSSAPTPSTDLSIPENRDGLVGEGAQTGGYVGNEKAMSALESANEKVEQLESEGKTINDPEMQQAKFEQAYWEKLIEYADDFGEEALKDNPELAHTLHTAAVADATAEVLKELNPSTGTGDNPTTGPEDTPTTGPEDTPTTGPEDTPTTGTRDRSAAAACQRLENKEGEISGRDMFNAIKSGTQDKDNATFGAEFTEFLEFAKDNWDRMSPEAQEVFLTYQNAAMDARKNGETGASDSEYAQLLMYLEFAASGMDTTGDGKVGGGGGVGRPGGGYCGVGDDDEDSGSDSPRVGGSGGGTSSVDDEESGSGPNQVNQYNPTNTDHPIGEEVTEEETEETSGDTSSSSSVSGRTGSPRGPRAPSGEMSMEVSRGRLEFDGVTYANAFQYAEAIFADMAYLMQDLLKTKVDELKIMKDEVAKANEMLATLNGATKDKDNKILFETPMSDEEAIAEVEKDKMYRDRGQAYESLPSGVKIKNTDMYKIPDRSSPYKDKKGENAFRFMTPEEIKQKNASSQKTQAEFVEFADKELGMTIPTSGKISNEMYEQLKTKLESYISSRQTDMQKLSSDIQSIKDKFDQMWRMVTGLINMEGDLNKTMVGNIR